jgi:excisionase family DNA binding protein
MKSVSEIAEILGVKACTVYSWIHTKQIPHYKVGSLVKFRINDIEAWLKDRRVDVVDLDTLI